MKPYLALLILPLIAAVQIDGVYYDADNEAGSEYVLLANTGEHSVSLEEWTLATPTSETDATLTGTISPRSTYLVADAGFREHKDNPDWPEADHEETLTLPNTAGYVQLVDPDGVVHSTVGWGEAQRSEAAAHPGTQEGHALVRINDTQDNSADFTSQEPTFTSAPEATGTSINVTVEDTPPRITNYSVEDDDPTTQAIELLPTPGEERRVRVSVRVEDDNTLSDVSVTANGEELLTNDTGTSGVYSGSIPVTTQTSEIEILVSDASHQEQLPVPVHLLGVSALSIPPGIQLTVKPGSTATTTIPVTNTGTQPVDLQVKGTAPAWTQTVLGNVSYRLAGEQHPLQDTFRLHAIALAPGETAQLELTISAGKLPARAYAGKIYVAGSPAR